MLTELLKRFDWAHIVPPTQLCAARQHSSVQAVAQRLQQRSVHLPGWLGWISGCRSIRRLDRGDMRLPHVGGSPGGPRGRTSRLRHCTTACRRDLREQGSQQHLLSRCQGLPPVCFRE